MSITKATLLTAAFVWPLYAIVVEPLPFTITTDNRIVKTNEAALRDTLTYRKCVARWDSTFFGNTAFASGCGKSLLAVILPPVALLDPPLPIGLPRLTYEDRAADWRRNGLSNPPVWWSAAEVMTGTYGLANKAGALREATLRAQGEPALADRWQAVREAAHRYEREREYRAGVQFLCGLAVIAALLLGVELLAGGLARRLGRVIDTLRGGRA